VRDCQEEAAQSAATVGQFVREWRRGVDGILSPWGAKGEGARSLEDWRFAVEDRDRKIQEAARGNENLRIGRLSADTNGEALIGGGDAGIVLNQDRFALLGEGEEEGGQEPEDIRMTAGHEKKHGKTVQLRGVLFDERRKPIPHEKILEGDGEVGGNEEVGKDPAHVREGQPEPIYGEGQRLVLTIMRRVGRDAFERTMRGDGDLSRLQPAFSRN
jgi:hypothetical protein